MLVDRMGAPLVTIDPVHDQEDNDCDGDDQSTDYDDDDNDDADQYVGKQDGGTSSDHRPCSELI